MRHLLRAAAVSLLLFVVVGCAARSTPRIRVANDLGCTEDQTKVMKISSGPVVQNYVRADLERWRVSGCGRSANYVCTVGVKDCWREGNVVVDRPQVAEAGY